MPKKRNHFVPKFLLRQFASDRGQKKKPKLIHLFNIKSEKFHNDIGLEDQCYKKFLYGESGELENLLMELEGKFASLIRKIMEIGHLPLRSSDAHELLLTFIATQYLRTEFRVNKQNDFYDAFFKKLLVNMRETMSKTDVAKYFGEDFSFPSNHEIKENYRIELENVSHGLISITPEVVSSLTDLKPLLISTNNSDFIISDNPIAVYNQYFEDVKKLTNSGLASRGIQLFIPLSPYVTIILFDENIYVSKDENCVVKEVTEEDIYFLNLLQYVTANENLYYSDVKQEKNIKAIHKNSERFRHSIQSVFTTLDHPSFKSNNKSFVFQSTNSFPKIRLNLSFLQIKGEVSKIKVKDKIKELYRTFRK